MCVVIFYRCDFKVEFDSDNPTSVFHLLQQACIEMGRISYSIWQKASAAKSPQHYQKLVYDRFMWGECVS